MSIHVSSVQDRVSHGPTAVSTAPRRLMVIFNPTAGGARGRRLRRVLNLLRRRGCRLDLRETARRGDAEAFAAGLRPDETDVVAVAGGDGTVNEVINGMMRSPAFAAGGLPPLGIIPLGTANVLALEIGLGTRPARIARMLAEGTSRPVSLGLLDERLFLLMGGAGFDAHVVENVRLGLKRATGKLAYVWEMLVQALRYDFPTIRLVIDGTRHEAATAVVCNGRLYGGPFVAAPEGDLTQSGLHVVLLRRKGLWNVARYAAALALGRLPTLKDVDIIPCVHEATLLEPAGDPLQADGDLFCRLPVTAKPSPHTLDLLFPPG